MKPERVTRPKTLQAYDDDDDDDDDDHHHHHHQAVVLWRNNTVYRTALTQR